MAQAPIGAFFDGAAVPENKSHGYDHAEQSAEIDDEDRHHETSGSDLGRVCSIMGRLD